MLDYRFLSTVLCASFLALTACDKQESLGEVESETAGESDSQGETDTDGVNCPADAMICPDGTAVGRSGPDCEFDPCPGDTDTDTDGIACPTDAMICPDGTAVGRSGPDCEFDPCPGDTDGDTDGDPICAPDDEFFEPAACPTEFGNGYVIDADCQTECLIDTPNCDAHEICMPVEVNPCVCDEGEDCCAACAAGMTLCVPVSEGEACDAIVGNGFASLEEYECGLGKDGPVMCNWNIEFDTAGLYMWTYSDVGQGGEFACKDGAISLSNDPSLVISYDAESGILTWDGIEYAVQ
jgi:hypothetical protein